MKKEIILILSYCPTKAKKEILYNFLQSLQKYRNEYDIMLASHVPLDSFYFEYFDYFYFDKNNEILFDDEYRFNSWYSPTGTNYEMWSNYVEFGNTIKAIYDMLIPSLNLIKILKYRKVHYFEYDTILFNNLELIDNSILLDNYDYVVYGTEGTHKMAGSLLSFNINGIIDEWKEINDDTLSNMFKNEYPKIPENIIFEQITTQKKYIVKPYNTLINNGINTALVRGNELNWNVPFYDSKTEKLKLLCNNTSDITFKTTVIVNGNTVLSEDIHPTYWRTFDLMDDIKDVKNIVILKNYNKSLEINFNNDSDLELFKKYNFIEYKN